MIILTVNRGCYTECLVVCKLNITSTTLGRKTLQKELTALQTFNSAVINAVIIEFLAHNYFVRTHDQILFHHTLHRASVNTGNSLDFPRAFVSTGFPLLTADQFFDFFDVWRCSRRLWTPAANFSFYAASVIDFLDQTLKSTSSPLLVRKLANQFPCTPSFSILKFFIKILSSLLILPIITF